MALHNCKNPRCTHKASGRNLFDAACWWAIPAELRTTVRQDTKKGEHTLRANPSRDWVSRALNYLGNRAIRTFQTAP